MKPAYPLKLTCKEATALMLAQEDRALTLANRAALRLHLVICKACPHFENQLLTMRHAMKQWRGYADGKD